MHSVLYAHRTLYISKQKSTSLRKVRDRASLPQQAIKKIVGKAAAVVNQFASLCVKTWLWLSCIIGSGGPPLMRGRAVRLWPEYSMFWPLLNIMTHVLYVPSTCLLRWSSPQIANVDIHYDMAYVARDILCISRSRHPLKCEISLLPTAHFLAPSRTSMRMNASSER